MRTVAVLPRVKATVTKSVREHFGLPRCTQGKTFHGEPVPTDVELGPDGLLYVTTLGGALGEAAPVGAIYQIDPATGETHRTTKGLMSPVGLAIAPNGAAYISLLFPGLIMRQPAGGAPEVFETAAFPGDVEYFGSTVYATLTDLTNEGDSPPAGQVVRWPSIDGCRGARC